MTLEQFLAEVGGKESDIITYEGDKALEAVKQNCYALRYVKEQTEAICLEAVKQNCYALRYVKEQTEAICLEAVKQDGYALQYVKKSIFKEQGHDTGYTALIPAATGDAAQSGTQPE